MGAAEKNHSNDDDDDDDEEEEEEVGPSRITNFTPAGNQSSLSIKMAQSSLLLLG